MKSILLAVILLVSSLNVFALKVVITATLDSADKPTVVGTTNLPDGIELMVTLKRKESAFLAQDKTNVIQGKFRAGPFSQNGASLNPGTYSISVSMSGASFQPPATWPIIGNDGTNLEGPIAKKSNFGGRIVEYNTTFKVGYGKASGTQDNESRAQSTRDNHAWWLQSCKKNCKMVQTIATNKGEAFDSDRCYYKCVAEEGKK